MTVAAVILAASSESALTATEGQPRVRRLVDIAWSGGAVPIVVVAPDPTGAVAVALAGAPVTLADPAPSAAGPVGQIARGIDVALEAVRDTVGAFVWPARMVWVGPETVTSLIEAYGMHKGTVLRPTFEGQPGWPVLVPLEALATFRGLGSERMPDELIDDLLAAGAASVQLEVGDPGVTHDAGTARADLPAYVGPPQLAGSRPHEWGAALAELPDDAPLSGPTLAPLGAAEEP
jgi:CTP:molybdopterin cytidylyltransferase MocA